MALKTPFKHEKLKVHVYGNRRRLGLPQQTFEVMFNPMTLSMQYQNEFQKYQGINTSGRRAMYTSSRSSNLQMELVFDGTGVTQSPLLSGPVQSVKTQVERFLDLCFHMDGNLHEPKFLKLQWGILDDFDCRLQSVDITYESFDKDGMPLHAKLAKTFVEDLHPSKRARKEGKSSPDLSHTRLVKRGDTLPLLTKEIYGTSSHYLRVAQVNGLDDFRNLTPGQTLFFPPLES